MHAADLVRHGLADADLPLPVREGAEIDIKYSGYLQRQQQQIDQVKRQSQRKLPSDLNYASIGTLSNEAREKLSAIQPTTLGQANRIPGVSQADITALLDVARTSKAPAPRPHHASSIALGSSRLCFGRSPSHIPRLLDTAGGAGDGSRLRQRIRVDAPKLSQQSPPRARGGCRPRTHRVLNSSSGASSVGARLPMANTSPNWHCHSWIAEQRLAAL
jgi:hypothetical protein